VADWATELGVASITFFQSERSIVRLRDEKERATRKERFLKIARAAAQQSKRSTVPEIVLVKSLADGLSFVPSEGIKLTCSLAPDAIPLQTAISGSPSRSSVHLVVGPEGDFSPTEESLLENSGFIRASLGGTVLRAELAVVAAILLTLFSTDT
jgi:16S rRNA (uracil1498-N3)-methyltransferase